MRVPTPTATLQLITALGDNMVRYTWVDGVFMINDGTKGWQPLTAYPVLSNLESVLKRKRDMEIGMKISQGWVLHQMWVNDPNYQLVKPTEVYPDT